MTAAPRQDAERAREIAREWLGDPRPRPALKQHLTAVCRALLAAHAEMERLREAIENVLGDAESGNGWGPDVTVCAYLREALGPTQDTEKK